MLDIKHQLKKYPPVDLKELIEITPDGFIAYFQQYKLKSVFQPIFSFAHDAPIGYEALLRTTDINNQAIPPIDLFSNIVIQDELTQLEQLSRTLHILNFFRENTNNALLFLNINPRLIQNSNNCLKQLLELLNEYDIPPTRIVIEFVEESFTDINIMIKATNYLRQSGCLIAIDDFGAGHSNFNRVWDLRPDIVKLDKSLINRIREDSYFQRPITNLVELLHESESLVLIEGVEDANDADIAHELGVDFHQGFFFGHPKQLSFSKNRHNYYLKGANERTLRNKIPSNSNKLSEQLNFLFRQAVMNSYSDINLNQSCEGLLNHPSTLLCYILDEAGYQIGDSVHGAHSTHNLDNRFGKIGMTSGVNWSRRNYFQRALSEPMVIQSTQPYLSITSAKMCVTLSMATHIENKTYILCCDVKVN